MRRQPYLRLPRDGSKAHSDHTILWWDCPRFGSPAANGFKRKDDFVAMVRGNDGKYCYVTFTVDLERRAATDTENISPAPDGNGETSGTCCTTSVPGVP